MKNNLKKNKYFKFPYFQIFIGLFHRKDWEKIKDIPIAFLPGGKNKYYYF